MSDTDILGKLQDIVGSDNIVSDEPMRKHTTFRIGGNADIFVRPESKEQIAEILRLCRKQDVPYFILGNGSNLLVGDRGFRGVVINIMDNMNDIKVDGGVIKAQAGAMLIKVSRAARDNSLTGLEFASGIPGTIGGAIYMNAGAYGGEMKDTLFIRVNRKTSFYISTNEFRSVFHVNSFPCLHRLHHTGIHRIPFRESSPGIFQYIIIGSFGIHNSHMGH